MKEEDKSTAESLQSTGNTTQTDGNSEAAEENPQVFEKTPTTIENEGVQSSTTPSDTTPTTPPESPKPSSSKKKILIIIGIAILLLAALVVGGYFYYQNQQSEEAMETQPTQMQNETPETPISTPNPTVGWQTYTNEENGFSIKIPSDYSQESYSEGDYQGLAFYSPEVPKVGSELREGLVIRTLAIENTTTPLVDYAQKSLDNELNSPPNNEIEGVSSSTLKQISLNGGTAYQYQIEGYGNGIVTFIELDNNNILRISGLYEGTSNEKQKYIDTFNQILSTFQFTGEGNVVSTTDWRSYTFPGFEEYDTFSGFSILYPPSWTINADQQDGSPKLFTLTLNKDSSTIKIQQLAGGTSNCLYPEDPNEEGMYARFGEYIEITKDDGTSWRIAKPLSNSKNNIYTVCQNPQPNSVSEYYVGMTSVGFISIDSPAPLTKDSEIIEILENIRVDE